MKASLYKEEHKNCSDLSVIRLIILGSHVCKSNHQCLKTHFRFTLTLSFICGLISKYTNTVCGHKSWYYTGDFKNGLIIQKKVVKHYIFAVKDNIAYC